MDSRVVAAERSTLHVEGETENLGRRLKAIRTELGITLAQLGRMVGLSASYLSQIERNKTKPSLATLSSMAKTLDVELSYFFEHATPVWQVLRKGHGEEVEDRRSKATFELLSSGGVGGQIEPYRVTCRPATRMESDTHAGEEFVFILEGQLEVRVGEEVHTLGVGDSIHYQGSQAHAWRNASEKKCVLLWAHARPFLSQWGVGEGG